MFNDEQVGSMTLDQCHQALKQLDLKYGLDKTIVKFTDELNEAVNSLLRLEDRIKFLNEPHSSAPVEPVEEPPKLFKPRAPTLRRVQTPKGQFENIDEACEQLGIKRLSIINYISSRGSLWYYLED
jgi:hypothetical protein